MILNLPWFIQQEIMDYIFINDLGLCLVNKGWFTYSAEECIVLNYKMINYKPSKWFKLARKLNLEISRDLNWSLLTECKNISSVSLTLENELNHDFYRLEAFINNVNLNSFVIHVRNDEVKEQSLKLIELISKRVSRLSINCSNVSSIIDRLLFNVYPRIDSFNINSKNDTVDIKKILQFMPNIRFLYFHTNNIILQNVNTNNLLFYNLKILIFSISVPDLQRNYDIVEYLLQFYFPVLTTFKFLSIIQLISLDKISRNMPMLKILYLKLLYTYEFNTVFPTCNLTNLEELQLNYEDYYGISPIQLNLNTLPKLRKLQICKIFNFTFLDFGYQPQINYFEFKASNYFQYQDIFDKLLFLNELSINCEKYNGKYYDLFNVCTKVKKITLTGLKTFIPIESLPAGPFNAIHLSLFGNKFLDNTIINWIASEFKLIQLTLNYSDEERILNPIFLPALQKLTIKCPNQRAKNYLESILNFNNINI